MADNITRTEKELVFRTGVAASDAVMDRFHLKEKEDSVEIEKGVKAAALISSLATRNVFKKTFDDVYTKIRSFMTDSLEEKMKTSQVVQPEISSRVIRVSRERKEKIEEKVVTDVVRPAETEQIERVDTTEKTKAENRVFAQSSDYEDVQREKRATEEWVDLGEANEKLSGFLTFWDPLKNAVKKKARQPGFFKATIVPIFGLVIAGVYDLIKELGATERLFSEMIEVDLSKEGGGLEFPDTAKASVDFASMNEVKFRQLDKDVQENNEELLDVFKETGTVIIVAVDRIDGTVKEGEHSLRSKIDTRTWDKTAEQLHDLQTKAYAATGAKAVFEFDVSQKAQIEKARSLLEKGYVVQPTAKKEEDRTTFAPVLEEWKKTYDKQMRLKTDKAGNRATVLLDEKTAAGFNEHLDWYLENTKGESLVTQTKKIANYFAESDRRLYSTIQRKQPARPMRIERTEQAKAVPVRQAKPASRAEFVTAEPTVKKRQPEKAKVEQKKLELPKRKEVVKKNFVELPVEQRQGEQQEITVPNELTPYFDQMADIINNAADSLNRR